MPGVLISEPDRKSGTPDLFTTALKKPAAAASNEPGGDQSGADSQSNVALPQPSGKEEGRGPSRGTRSPGKSAAMLDDTPPLNPTMYVSPAPEHEASKQLNADTPATSQQEAPAHTTTISQGATAQLLAEISGCADISGGDSETKFTNLDTLAMVLPTDEPANIESNRNATEVAGAGNGEAVTKTVMAEQGDSRIESMSPSQDNPDRNPIPSNLESSHRKRRPYAARRSAPKPEGQMKPLATIESAETPLPPAEQPRQYQAPDPLRPPSVEQIERFWLFSEGEVHATGNHVDNLLKDLEGKGVNCQLFRKYRTGVASGDIPARQLCSFILFLKREGAVNSNQAVQVLRLAGDAKAELQSFIQTLLEKGVTDTAELTGILEITNGVFSQHP